jgi:nitroreductase
MTVTEALIQRRSVRKFDDRPVPREILERILELTLTAPSSKNSRSSRFMVIDKPELLAKIAEMRDFGSAFVAAAPCGVLILGDVETDLWVDNAAISATVLQLAAQEAGLGSCWVHVNGRARKAAEPDGETAADYLRTFLPITEGWAPLCFVALGYAANPHRPHTPQDDADKVVWL